MIDSDGFVRHQIGREPGDYDCDRWQQKALAAGVSAQLAKLGRDTMREAIQHSWHRDFQDECGWGDDGAAMIRLALEAPDTAQERWKHLLETDGEYGHYDTDTGQWISHF